MKVSELVEILKAYDQNMEVVIETLDYVGSRYDSIIRVQKQSAVKFGETKHFRDYDGEQELEENDLETNVLAIS